MPCRLFDEDVDVASRLPGGPEAEVAHAGASSVKSDGDESAFRLRIADAGVE